MAGKQLTATRMAQLEKLGEEEIFRRYVELGSVKKMCQELWPPRKKDEESGTGALYEWLQSKPDRWQRWQNAKLIRAEVHVELAGEAATTATTEDVQVKRLEFEYHKWATGILNRDYRPGNSTNVQVNVGVGDAWLDALRKLETIKAEVVG